MSSDIECAQSTRADGKHGWTFDGDNPIVVCAFCEAKRDAISGWEIPRAIPPLFVPGDAAPQGSKRHVGGGRMVESSKSVGPWRERIALAAHGHGWTPGTGPVAVYLLFVRPRPLSTPKSRRPPATKKPDLDKLSRAVLDALTGIAYADDAQVVDLHARKRLAALGETPGVRITVTPIVEAE
ncbi:RusA family crossover junction endodeoxyribonuclease [Nocardia tengchongensis]|uniref:RusA family crossover junction endodeoxyribonuclease n=1 Tax=Nocardia tengchongensis TaxID=2055889 RepID=UPI0036206D26